MVSLVRCKALCVGGHSFDISISDSVEVGFIDFTCPTCESKFFRIIELYPPSKAESTEKADNSAMNAMMVSRMSNLCARLAAWGMMNIVGDLALEIMIRDALECAKYYKIPSQHQYGTVGGNISSTNLQEAKLLFTYEMALRNGKGDVLRNFGGSFVTDSNRPYLLVSDLINFASDSAGQAEKVDNCKSAPFVCGECGAEVFAHHKFCWQCGSAL